MSQISGLTVRQHERLGIELPAEFIICDEHCKQVRFSAESSALNHFSIACKALDISSGGLGLESNQFLPRMTEGIVRVYSRGTITASSVTSPGSLDDLGLLLEHRVKVRRVYLIGREPSFALGVAFVDPEPDIDKRVEEILERLRTEGHTLAPQLDEGDTHA